MDSVFDSSNFIKTGAWVLGAHVLAIAFLVLGIYLKPNTEFIMMAEMIDRQSSALVQNFTKSNDAKEIKDKKEALKLSDSASELENGMNRGCAPPPRRLLRQRFHTFNRRFALIQFRRIRITTRRNKRKYNKSWI